MAEDSRRQEKSQVVLAEEREAFFCLFFLLSLGLELFPEGPFQLRNRQSEGEGAV